MTTALIHRSYAKAVERPARLGKLDVSAIDLDAWPPRLRVDEAFHKLPVPEQKSIRELWWAMLLIEQSASKDAGARIAATLFLGEAGRSHKSLTRFYNRWIAKDRHYGALRNFQRAPLEVPAQKWPQRFIDHLGHLIQANQRNTERALRTLRRQLEHGDNIPGLGTWKTIFAKQYPDKELPRECPRLKDLLPGLSRDNLRRIQDTTERQLKIARVGTAAAAPYLPYIPRTRRGVRFLEYIMIDDLWRDRKVLVPGMVTPCRLLQFTTIDLSSSFALRFGLRPEIKLPDGTRDRLKERDVFWVIGMTIQDFGLPLDYPMHILCERGTATVRPASARAIYELTEGRVIVGYTSMNGEFVCGWEERAVGNWKGKGLIESFHNLIHNQDASNPGQMGKDRDHSPQRLPAQEKLAERLLKVAALLPAEEKLKFKPPFATIDEAFHQTLDLFDIIHDDPDHECEGFDRVPGWRLKGSIDHFKSRAELANYPDLNQEAIEWNPHPPLETRRQRMLKLRGQNRFAKVPPWVLKGFYECFHVEGTIDDRGYFKFRRDEDYIYRAPSPEEELPTGTDCLGYFNPLDMSEIILTHRGGSKHGAYIGVWPRFQVAWGDRPAQAEAAKYVRGVLNQALAVIERRDKYAIADQLNADRAALEALAEANLLSNANQSRIERPSLPEPDPSAEATIGDPPGAESPACAEGTSSAGGNGNGTALQTPRFPAPATPSLSDRAARRDALRAKPTTAMLVAEKLAQADERRARARTEKRSEANAASEALDALLSGTPGNEST